MKLEPGIPVEREIAGGESHSYQISLTAGHFARLRLEQRAIDVALILNAPDGKQLVEMNLTRAGDEESLSLEAAVSGVYHLTVRVGGLATLRGTYRFKAVGKAAATAQDKQRIAAESLMIESDKVVSQGGKAAPKIIENMQQALAIRSRTPSGVLCPNSQLTFSSLTRGEPLPSHRVYKHATPD